VHCIFTAVQHCSTHHTRCVCYNISLFVMHFLYKVHNTGRMRTLCAVCLQNIVCCLFTEHCVLSVYRTLCAVCLQNIVCCLPTEHCVLSAYRTLCAVCLQNIVCCLFTEHCVLSVYRRCCNWCYRSLTFEVHI
jgi:hypothetical protein